MPFSQTPAYNLKVVLKETGIAADTLRAWERRYGLPMPERTEGGHRLYSHRDIEIIKWLMKQQESGLSISRAVDLWKEQSASGTDPLAGAIAPAFSLTQSSLPNGNLEVLRREWLDACFRYDTISAEQILNQSFATHTIEIVCTDIILRGLFEIGEYWHQGTASIQQEHFASELATRKLEALISATPPPTRNEVILLACPPQEWHAFPLLVTTLFLRRRSWNAIYLGTNVPTDRIDEMLKTVKPKLVILAAQTLVNAVNLREMARVLNEKGIPSGVGGRIFNTISRLHTRIPAHFLGNTIEYSIPAIENLIANPRPVPSEEKIKDSTRRTAASFRQMRFQIEGALMEEIASSGRPFEFIETANRFLGESLIAALELGDISYLSTDITWITNLLTGHKVTVSMLPIYLEMYARNIDEVMGESGKEISDWLKLESARLNQ